MDEEIKDKDLALGSFPPSHVETAKRRPHDCAKNEVWNWLPSVQRVIKIPPSMMLQSWMGSDFNNDDLVRQSSIVEDYEHETIGEEEHEKNRNRL